VIIDCYCHAGKGDGLAMQDHVSALGGQVGLTFTYGLFHNDNLLPLQTSLEQASIGDGASLDLRISVQQYSPDGKLTPVEFRGTHEDLGSLPPAVTRKLVLKAFSHLVPKT
jgi:hypothetical protein